MKKSMHYSGGIRAEVGKYFTIRLRGWPVCCSGDKCEKIASHGNMTSQRRLVSCKACLKLLAAQDAYEAKKASAT